MNPFFFNCFGSVVYTIGAGRVFDFSCFSMYFYDFFSLIAGDESVILDLFLSFLLDIDVHFCESDFFNSAAVAAAYYLFKAACWFLIVLGFII